LEECTIDACIDGACAHTQIWGDGCCLPPLFKDDFSEDKGWDYDEEWARAATFWDGGGSLFGYPDPGADHTTSDDNYVAGAIPGNVVTNYVHDWFWLTSPTVDSTGASNLHLTFWRWLNSDYLPYMQNAVEVKGPAGWTQVWESGETPPIQDKKWFFQDFDVTEHAGPEFQVRFGFTIPITGAMPVSGWNVDDVMVVDRTPDEFKLCCDYVSDCQGLYPPGNCLSGTCE